MAQEIASSSSSNNKQIKNGVSGMKLNIHELLIEIVERVEDLQGIIITDIDGITVC